MKKLSVSEWRKRIKEGREKAKDDERSYQIRSHGNDENVGKVRNLMHSDRRLSIRAMAVQLNINKETVKMPELWINGRILHHDSTLARKALSVK